MTASDSRPISARLKAAWDDAPPYVVLEEALTALFPEVERLERENSRLRAALAEIASLKGQPLASRFARRALEGEIER